MTPEQQEKARVVAEWLNLELTYQCSNSKCDDDHPIIGMPPDFLNDESASALILENLHGVKLRENQIHRGLWTVELPKDNSAEYRLVSKERDRLAAIFNAGYQEAMRVKVSKSHE